MYQTVCMLLSGTRSELSLNAQHTLHVMHADSAEFGMETLMDWTDTGYLVRCNLHKGRPYSYVVMMVPTHPVCCLKCMGG